MFKNVLLVCVSIALLQTTAGNDPCVIGNGHYLKTNWELDLHKFYGSYYALYILNNDFLDQYRCWIDNYYVSGDKTVHSTETYSVKDEKRIKYCGNVTYNGHTMLKQFPTWPELTTNFNIIGACPDYQFVIFGGCPEATQGEPLVWIDFRNPNPSESDVKAATKIIEENGMNITDFGNGCKNKAEYILN